MGKAWKAKKRLRRKQRRLIRAEQRQTPEIPLVACETTIQADDAGGDGKRPVTVAVRAYNGGELRVPGYSLPVVIALDGLQGLGRPIPLLRDHDTGRVIGYVEAQIRDGVLVANGRLTGNSADRHEVAEQAADGFPWQASVGVRPNALVQVKAGETIEVNGRTFRGPLYVATRARLAELTICAVGADAETEVSVAAMDQGGEIVTKETDKSIEAADDGQKSSRLADKRQELERKLAIEAKAAELLDTIDDVGMAREIEAAANKAIVDGMTAQQFELEMLRKTRGVRGRVSVGQERDGRTMPQQIEAAVLLHLGYTASDLERDFPEHVLNAMDANPRFRRGLSLQDLLIEAASANGHRDVSRHDLPALFRGAFQPIQASGISTINVSGILSNVANKRLRDAFNSSTDVSSLTSGGRAMAYRVLGATGSVSTFHQISTYSLTGDLTYDELAPGGEIKHGTLGETSYTNQAKTYAKMLGLDRRDIINDDLGALSRASQRLGRGAALKISDVWWTTFMNNSSFFTSARGNYATGATTALSIDAVADAEELFMLQTDADGKPLNVFPELLLVPPAVAALARQILTSTNVNNGSSSDTPDANPFAGRFGGWTSPYLQNAGYTGNSDKAWYLLADPGQMPVIETVFLNGRQMPTVESSDADFNQLGIQMRAYHDFGVALQEYRGGVKMKGEA